MRKIRTLIRLLKNLSLLPQIAESVKRLEDLAAEQADKSSRQTDSPRPPDHDPDDLRAGEIWARISRKIEKERKVVFISRGFFGDNLKYAFLRYAALSAEADDWPDHIWLTADPAEFELLARHGYRVKLWNRDDAPLVNYLLRARLAVKTDHFAPSSLGDRIPYALLAGARTFQLWHGAALTKKIALENIRSVSRNTAEVVEDCLQTDVVLSRSRTVNEEMRKSFQAKEVVNLGHPRLDIFRRSRMPGDMLNVDVDLLAKMEACKKAGKKVVFYAPTFRDTGTDWLERVDFDPMRRAAAQHGALAVINLHPYEQGHANKIRDRLTGEDGFAFVRPGTDIYPLLALADILVTDYASILADFLMLDRPIVFFRPDHDDYQRSRELGVVARHDLPGPVATTIGQLTDIVFSDDIDSLHWQNRRRTLCDTLNENADGSAADRVAQKIRSLALENA